MQTNTRRRWSRAEPFIITPEIRASHLAHSRRAVVENWPAHAMEFPITYLATLLASWGMPLEATRWWNRNKHRPKMRIERWWKRLGAAWDDFKVSRYRIPSDAYAVGTEAELRQFVAHMREIKSKDGYGSTWRLGRYWFAEPNDKLVNREIVHPKTNGTYLAGAVGYRFDDYFFTFVALPYRFREIEPPLMMSILFPDVPLAEYEFQVDEHLKVWPGETA